MTTYAVTSGDGTIERRGLSSLDVARKVARDVAAERRDGAEIWIEGSGGDAIETIRSAARTIEAGDENMGTAEAATWAVGDRVEYSDGQAGDDAWARVRDLLGRRGLELHDDGVGYLVREREAR